MQYEDKLTSCLRHGPGASHTPFSPSFLLSSPPLRLLLLSLPLSWPLHALFSLQKNIGLDNEIGRAAVCGGEWCLVPASMNKTSDGYGRGSKGIQSFSGGLLTPKENGIKDLDPTKRNPGSSRGGTDTMKFNTPCELLIFWPIMCFSQNRNRWWSAFVAMW